MSKSFTRRDFLRNSVVTGGSLAIVRTPLLRGATTTLGPTAAGETYQLKCEYATNPLGIDVLRPRFSWQTASQRRGWLQSAYQILVATSSEKLKAGSADQWDSGRVSSDMCVGVPYSGPSLKSATEYYWKVRTWDEKARVRESSIATFEMGLLARSDWEGSWIAAKEKISAPLLRKEFTVAQQVARARVYISGVGYYELSINGKKVGDHVHDPGVTYYNSNEHELRSRVLYVTYDVTDYLKNGPNVVAVILGNGWYSPELGLNEGWLPGGPNSQFGSKPCLIMQMNVEDVNGATLHVVTDDSWKVSSGPITYNSFIDGETYDARLEKEGWNNLPYDDSGWPNAVRVANPPNGVLTAQMVPPIRIMETIRPVKILKPKDAELFWDVDVYDMGQNLTGWVKLRVSGQKGTVLTLEHGAHIYDDNTLDARSNLVKHSTAMQTDTYILKGEGIEEWEPKFTLHGFRYVQVRGVRSWFDKPPIDSLELEGRFVHSAVEISGSFNCSNQLINQIHHNNLWTFRGSCQSIPQDAADRAERVGWNGDPSFVAEDYIYNLDMSSFWTKWLNDFADSQKANGDIPPITPIPCGKGCQDLYLYPMPDWKSSYLILAWQMYQYYGDKRILEQHYERLNKFVEFLAASAHDFIVQEGIGDQMEPQDDGTSVFTARHTPIPLTSTAVYYWQVTIISQIAETLGKGEDARRWAALATQIKDAFNRKFLNPEANQYGSGSQTSNALPLSLGMVPETSVQGVLENLIHDIVQTHQGHHSTGVMGAYALEHALPQYGAADVMFQIATQNTFPSWGDQIARGATTTCETWECAPWISQNMKMLGMIEKFFYQDLAGIAPLSPGFKRVAIRPQVVGDLKFVSASLNTVAGSVSVNWRRADRSFEMQVTIPANSKARVGVPMLKMENVKITEGGNTVWDKKAYSPGVAGISAAREDGQYINFDVGSGTYVFLLTEA